MAKRIIIMVAIPAFLTACAAAYEMLWAIPAAVRIGIIDEIEAATGRKLSIGAFNFDVRKGLILENIALYEKKAVLFRAKEINCVLLPAPILKKKAIIPLISVDSPYFLLKRAPDGSFNVSKILSEEYRPRNDISASVYKIIFRNGRIDFIDETIMPNFGKRIDDINTSLKLSLPDKIAFEASFAVRGAPDLHARLSGEYSVNGRELSARICAENIALKDFEAYYKNSGISFPEGSSGLKMNLTVKDHIVNANIEAATKNILIVKDKLNVRTDSVSRTAARYDIRAKKLEYDGELDISEMTVDGIDTLGALEGIKAVVRFDESGLNSKNTSVNFYGIPWNVDLSLRNFAEPVLDVKARSDIDMAALGGLLEDIFKFSLPVDISGRGAVEFSIKTEDGKEPRVSGVIFVRDGVKLDAFGLKLEKVSGDIRFTPEVVTWTDLGFKYRDAEYKSHGEVSNFESPSVELGVTSKDISFESNLEFNEDLIAINRLKGKYLNSEFSVSGDLDLANPGIADADIEGKIEFDLGDINKLAGNRKAVNDARPYGKIRAEFDLAGNVGDIGSCNINARVESEHISVYGINMTDITFKYNQDKDSGRIMSMRSSLYGGSADIGGKIDWKTRGSPYAFTVNARGVKLESFKNDTAIKDKDISGDVKFYTVLKGIAEDPSSIYGTGKISIARGRLWQLNLFKGLGSLIFTSDFSDIVFTEGSCDFKVEGKRFHAYNLGLKSDLLRIYGSGEIGFDRSISSSLKAEVSDEAMSPGFRKNLVDAIGRYMLVEISGTLAEPRYSIRPSTYDIAEEIAGRIFRQR